MNPVMYLILNKSLGMSTGKAAAQASHAAVEAYRLSMSLEPDEHVPPMPHMNAAALYERNEVRLWYKGGHYTKIVLEAEGDFGHLHKYLYERGFVNALIIDEGRTEIDPFTPTAIGCAIVDKNNPHVQATFGEFKLYNDKPKYVVLDERLSVTDAMKVREALDNGWPIEKALTIVRSQRPNGRKRSIRQFLAGS